MAALTTEQIQQITTDRMNGKQPRVQCPEADQFRQSLERDIAEAARNGWVIEIPPEFP